MIIEFMINCFAQLCMAFFFLIYKVWESLPFILKHPIETILVVAICFFWVCIVLAIVSKFKRS